MARTLDCGVLIFLRSLSSRLAERARLGLSVDERSRIGARGVVATLTIGDTTFDGAALERHAHHGVRDHGYRADGCAG